MLLPNLIIAERARHFASGIFRNLHGVVGLKNALLKININQIIISTGKIGIITSSRHPLTSLTLPSPASGRGQGEGSRSQVKLFASISPNNVFVIAFTILTETNWPISDSLPGKFTTRLFSVRPDNWSS